MKEGSGSVLGTASGLLSTLWNDGKALPECSTCKILRGAIRIQVCEEDTLKDDWLH